MPGLVALASEVEEVAPESTETIETAKDTDETTENVEQEENEDVQIGSEAVVVDDVETVAETGENAAGEVNAEEQDEGETLDTEFTETAEDTEGIIEDVEIGDDTQIMEDPVELEQAEEVGPTSPAATLGAGEEVVVDTGDSVSVVEVENDVNTTVVDSEVKTYNLNVFILDGDIDLSSEAAQEIAQDVVEDTGEASVNVGVFEGENYAVIENDIVSFAGSGGNSATADYAVIKTGDTYSIVTLVNRVNTTIVGSEVYFVTINIFGDVNGNIILPELVGGPTPSSAPLGVEEVGLDNSAEVVNEVSSNANTGGNSAAEVSTGDALSLVDIINLINQNYINTLFYYLNINVLGSWEGEFLGWGEGGIGGVSECIGCYDDLSVGNQAYVYNRVASTADSGGNSAVGGGYVETGGAVSSVSIINMVNTNIINSSGFIGIINIFGRLVGNIGGVSFFEVEDDPTPPAATLGAGEDVEEKEGGGATMEEGGELWVGQTNNIGTHVLPGDTITFFMNVKNTGTGKVYGTKLLLSLIDEYGEIGGVVFDLGDIEPGKGVKVTTGLVLSKSALGGSYIARATAFGRVGPDGAEISAFADSDVLIKGLLPAAVKQEGVLGMCAWEPEEPEPDPISFDDEPDEGLTNVLVGLVTAAIAGRGIQKRKSITNFFTSFL